MGVVLLYVYAAQLHYFASLFTMDQATECYRSVVRGFHVYKNVWSPTIDMRIIITGRYKHAYL